MGCGGACAARVNGSGVDEWTQSGGLCVGRLRRPGSSWTFPSGHLVFSGTSFLRKRLAVCIVSIEDEMFSE